MTERVDSLGRPARVERSPTPKEIERKFRVAAIPENLNEYPHTIIEQGYLAFDQSSEVRIRQNGDQYSLTAKKGAGLVREESEIELTKAQFDALWPHTQGRRVQKVRYLIPDGENVIELDVFRENLDGLVLAEVEFTDLTKSQQFSPPAWFAYEVTDDPAYKNGELATKGKPLGFKDYGNSSEDLIPSTPLGEMVRSVIAKNKAVRGEQTLELIPPRLYEVQTKFRTARDMSLKLLQAGAEFVGRVAQEDFYLQTPAAGNGQNEELIRIRRQGGKTTFAYKGKRVEGSGVRVRPKIEFEIDDAVASELIAQNQQKTKQVIKIRDFYQLGGLIVCSDSVLVKRGEEVVPAGQFVELRTTNVRHGEDGIRNVCQTLGLDFGERINASYLDIQLGAKDYTVFPKTEGETTPLTLYETMFPAFTTPRNEAYFSSPLTSGGAKKLFENQGEAIPTIIKLNSQFSETVAKESEDLIMAYKLTLPGRVGTRAGWREMDYMKFWMYYISGISLEGARRFDAMLASQELGLDAKVFNDYLAPRAERVTQYDKLIDAFAGFIHQEKVPINPVNYDICLPDYQRSLGCSGEVRLARTLQIPTLEVGFDRNHARFSKQIIPNAPWLLADDGNLLEEIVNNPAHYVVMVKPV